MSSLCVAKIASSAPRAIAAPGAARRAVSTPKAKLRTKITTLAISAAKTSGSSDVGPEMSDVSIVAIARKSTAGNAMRPTTWPMPASVTCVTIPHDLRT